jgi:Holliday junction DNA helicase RuvA
LEKEFFVKYITVPGIGIGKGLKSLTLPFSEVAVAIERRDAGRLASMPGLGRRTADKIIAELNGKMEAFCLGEIDVIHPTAEEPEYQAEAIAVLTQLGLTRAESQQRIENALRRGFKGEDVEQLVRQAFHTGPAATGGGSRKNKRKRK